jgi:hypothetical protein
MFAGPDCRCPKFSGLGVGKLCYREIWEVVRMFETLDKLMLAGLGALTMTRERAEKLFDEYVSQGR